MHVGRIDPVVDIRRRDPRLIGHIHRPDIIRISAVSVDIYKYSRYFFICDKVFESPDVLADQMLVVSFRIGHGDLFVFTGNAFEIRRDPAAELLFHIIIGATVRAQIYIRMYIESPVAISHLHDPRLALLPYGREPADPVIAHSSGSCFEIILFPHIPDSHAFELACPAG